MNELTKEGNAVIMLNRASQSMQGYSQVPNSNFCESTPLMGLFGREFPPRNSLNQLPVVGPKKALSFIPEGQMWPLI